MNVHNPNAPRPVETFHLGDMANAAIPEAIRHQFQSDEHGRVLFFSSLPIDPVASIDQGMGHSMQFLAARERKKEVIGKKRKEREESEKTERERKLQEYSQKRPKVLSITEETINKALNLLSSSMEESDKQFYRFTCPSYSHEAWLEDKFKYNQVIHRQKVEEDHLTKLKILPYEETVDIIPMGEHVAQVDLLAGGRPKASTILGADSNNRTGKLARRDW